MNFSYLHRSRIVFGSLSLLAALLVGCASTVDGEEPSGDGVVSGANEALQTTACTSCPSGHVCSNNTVFGPQCADMTALAAALQSACSSYPGTTLQIVRLPSNDGRGAMALSCLAPNTPPTVPACSCTAGHFCTRESIFGDVCADMTAFCGGSGMQQACDSSYPGTTMQIAYFSSGAAAHTYGCSCM